MKTTGRDFMRATCYEHCTDPTPQEAGEPQPPLELPLDTPAEIIHLPASAGVNVPEISLRIAIERRKTHRLYQNHSLSLAELSYLLWLTQGVKTVTRRPVTLRTVPSAGARHAFETYLLVNKVEGLEPGLYRFLASNHALACLSMTAGLNEQITHACLDQQQVTNSAVTFLWVAVTARMTWRYVERGYRYLHLDAGHVCQNLYLAAEAIHCGVCAIAAFEDELLNAALGLDGEELWVIYAASVGKVKVT